MGHSIILPDDICNYEYDVIVIMSYLYNREIAKELQKRNIDTWRIVNGGKFYDKWDRKLYYINITPKYIRTSRCEVMIRYGYKERT